MQLRTILNRVENPKSFVYGKVKWVDAEEPTIEVQIETRRNGRPICSGCQQPAPGYDRLSQQRFEFVPLWGIAVYFVYAMRRVECPTCGVKVERVPWCDGKNQLTTTYRWFLAGCAPPNALWELPFPTSVVNTAARNGSWLTGFGGTRRRDLSHHAAVTLSARNSAHRSFRHAFSR
jgi:transposase